MADAAPGVSGPCGRARLDDMNITQALISVSDKTGVVEFARALHELGIHLISTGGSAKVLRDSGLPVTEVSDYTGFPEMLDGRVKTLHPKVHGGILARRDQAAHLGAIESAGIPRIDLVVVNLYNFGETIARPGCSLDEAIENIDIGGPAMVRAAAKNYGGAAGGVGVVTDPSDYPSVLEELRANGCRLGLATRFALAVKAFTLTARYDGAIANYLSAQGGGSTPESFPASLQLAYDKVEDLRYGENPHQKAAFYRDPRPLPGGIARFAQLQGKELSYNNIADADAAWECVKSFDRGVCACVIVKHANPCGVALGASAVEAYRRAFATDPTSAFGGIIAFNCPLDGAAAEAIMQQFVEVIIAPEVVPQAREILAMKQNVRLLQVPLGTALEGYEMKRVGGGLLVQSRDEDRLVAADLKVVTKRSPTQVEFDDLLFAWRVAKHVKSNAIVYCRNAQTVGIGAGQMSRVDSARIAAMKAQGAALPLQGSVVASDAFFPFRDGLDVVAEAGARAVVQPGGSVRDAEVIAAADERDIAMVFTGVRHFKH